MGLQKAPVSMRIGGAIAMSFALAIVMSIGSPDARAERTVPQTLIHAELDPLTFANQPGYGGQIGVRHRALGGVRLAIASFALHVPDVLTSLLGNDGWDVTVRPSGAIYGLYYLRDPRENGFAVGASIRFLRFRIENDTEPGRLAYREVSPEAIVAYQWHPFDSGFYLQPWFALGVTVWRSADTLATSTGVAYEPLLVNPFFTVNVGYEH